MTAFNRSVYMLLTMGLLILAGNTAYPVFLRFSIWMMRVASPRNDRWKDFQDTLKFLLDHPRRCYTNLLPSKHTWFLLLTLFVLNGIDTVGFIVLNVSNSPSKDLACFLNPYKTPDRQPRDHETRSRHRIHRWALPSLCRPSGGIRGRPNLIPSH